MTKIVDKGQSTGIRWSHYYLRRELTVAGYKHTNSKGVTYYLNSKMVTLRGGKEQRIFYFSKDQRPETECDKPEDMEVGENPRNGFLTVRRIR